jgi:hypothetical protein
VEAVEAVEVVYAGRMRLWVVWVVRGMGTGRIDMAFGSLTGLRGFGLLYTEIVCPDVEKFDVTSWTAMILKLALR